MKTKILEMFKKHISVIWLGVLTVWLGYAVYSAVTFPHNVDVKVFFSSAYLARYNDAPHILGAIKSWEIKGPFNRIIIYIILSLCEKLIGFQDKILFEAVASFIYQTGTLLLLTLSTFLIGKKLKLKLRSTYLLFLFFALSIATSGPYMQLQTEMTCVICLILASSLLIYGTKWSLILSGVVLSLTVFIKPVFLLLVISVFLSIVIIDRHFSLALDWNPKKALTAYFGALVALSVFLLIFNPQEFVDLRDAGLFQGTLLTAGSNKNLIGMISSFENGLIEAIVSVPIILIGMISFFYYIILQIKKKDYLSVFLLMVVWIMPIDIIILGNKYFKYHYFLLVFCSIVSIILVKDYFSFNLLLKEHFYAFIAAIILSTCLYGISWLKLNGLNQIGIYNVAIYRLAVYHVLGFGCVFIWFKKNKWLTTLTIFVCSAFTFFTWLNFYSYFTPFHMNQREISFVAEEYRKENLYSKLELDDSSVLYLDNGLSQLYVGASSYSRYQHNLPLREWDHNKGNWDCQQSEYKKIMEYQGKYIITNEWLNISKYPEIQKYVEENYEIITDFSIPYSSADPFGLRDPNIYSQTGNYSVYQRKNN